MERLLNDKWQFCKNSRDNWEDVSLPHDWLIHDVNNLYETSIGYYKRALDDDIFGDVENKRVFLRFDGVYMDTTVYVNGVVAGHCKNGYTSFEIDITSKIKRQKNEVVVKVNYKAPNSRWYSGAGIYRDVRIVIKNEVYFTYGGIYITPRRVNGDEWDVEVSAEIAGDSSFGGSGITEMRHTITDAEGNTVFSPYSADFLCGSKVPSKEEQNKAEQNREPDIYECAIHCKNPALWDIDSPNLYYLKSEILGDEGLLDTVVTRFGFREIKYTPNDGFFLNGRRVKHNGVCQHHDAGALGAVADKDAIRRQLMKLREMGVNAIRTSHNPPASVFMELADEMGFMVLSEFTDMWRLPKTKYDYSRFFDDWAEKDAASWIRRDRNCPSIVMWSIGNEIYDTHADFEQGSKVMKMLMAYVSKHDPDAHAPVTLCSNYIPWENTQKCADIIKLIGYNYAEYLYHEHHAEHPDWLIFGSETGSTVQSRGVYHFPLSQSILADDDMQCSALGNSTTSWGAKSVEAFLNDDDNAPFSFGQYIWTGTDYIGEPTPYQTKNSYFGHIDTAGFPKDSFYIIQSAWTDYKKAPMIHIFPYWDFSIGQEIDVRVCSNAPAVELFLDGASLGRHVFDRSKGIAQTADYLVEFHRGVLSAKAYDEKGDILCETFRASFGDVEYLKTKTERYGVLAYCEITAYDKNNNPVENANNRVNVTVSGGELLGLDNGDSTDYDEYKTTSRRMFNGKLLAIARVTDETRFDIKTEIDKSDIPVRKIELIKDGLSIKAILHPSGAKNTGIKWRLTNSAGIDSPLGVIVPSKDGMSAIVAPKGDGRVYVRALIENGKTLCTTSDTVAPHADFYAVMHIDIEGFGTPFTNPYTFVSAGLYSSANTEVGNGNERGITTARNGESRVCFDGLEFGGYGSDEFELPLFPMSNDPFTFEVWEGVKPEGTMLGRYEYTLGSVWNTYQTMTVKLPKRLKGVATLCLVFDQKVHVKGFVFKKKQKAYERLYAADNDVIYGDAYKVRENKAVEGIGNNVSILYKDMDFGERGVSSVKLCTRSAKPMNSVKLVFTDENGIAAVCMLEVKGSRQYKETMYEPDAVIKHVNDVELVFLPGTALDLHYIEFKEKMR